LRNEEELMVPKKNDNIEDKIIEIEKNYTEKIKLKDDFIRELLKDFQEFDSTTLIDDNIVKEFDLKEKTDSKFSNKLKEKIIKIKHLLKTQTEIITEKEKLLSKLKNKNSELMGKIEKLNEEFSKESIEKKVISNKIIENNATIQRISDELATTRSKNKDLTSQMTSRNEELEELENINQNKTIQVNALKEEILHLEKELETLKNELINEIDNKDDVLSSVKIQFEKIQKIINDMDFSSNNNIDKDIKLNNIKQEINDKNFVDDVKKKIKTEMPKLDKKEMAEILKEILDHPKDLDLIINYHKMTKILK